MAVANSFRSEPTLSKNLLIPLDTKICGCEQETIGYQSELVGVENSPLVYFSPVRSKRPVLHQTDFLDKNFQMAGNNLLLIPT
jgi:hypothetical protein